jgi:4-amino-4-deoxy-L-arabinose transferase-like glycosyltransferase
MGGFVELSYDEAYYWIYSQFLSWGYFDHPPMVAVFIKAGTTLFNNEFGVRLFFNLASIITLYTLWTMTNKKKPYIFIMLSCALPLVQASGFLALPDTPLLLFSVLFIKQTFKYLAKDSIKNTSLLALTIALMFYSKYHGLLVVILTLLAIPSVCKRKSFWLVVVGSTFLYLPHMYWQYLHDFISFKFHLTGRAEKHFELNNIINYLSSQIALLGIFIFFVFIYNIKKIDFKNAQERILAFNVLGFLGLLFFVSFRNQIEANWTVSACGCFILLMYILFDRMETSRKKVLLVSSISILLIVVLRVVILLPESAYQEDKIGRLNEIKFWSKRIEIIKKHTKNFPLVAETYQYGAKVSFEMRKIIPVRHFRGRDSHYSMLNLTKELDENETIFYMTPRRVENAIKVETGYKDPIYIIKTTLKELKEKNPKDE